jgi:hypothetical protein
MKKVSAVLITLALLFFVTSVYAKPPFQTPNNPTATPKVTATPTPRPPVPNVVSPQVRLTAGLLQACQAHEKVITTRLNSLMRMATDMLATFTKIADRVETYYTGTVVPGGKTVDTYDALVADIQTKKTQVETDLTTAQNDANNFVCTGIDPKGHLNQFRIDMQEVKKSLKDFRTSIKNLIVAVHGVVGEGPTVTPTGAQQ